MEEPRNRFMAVWALIALVACWWVIALGPLSLVGAIAPFFLAVYFWRRSKGWSLVFAVANPLVLTALLAAGSYFRGTAALHFHGLPSPQAFNLDRGTMLPKVGGGCVVDGSEWLGDGWHNFVLRRCVALFGPMKGSPRISYPDESALTGPWQDVQWIEVADFSKGEIQLGGKSRTIPQGRRLLEAYVPWFHEEQASPPDPMWDDEEFAIRLQAKDFEAGAFAVRIGTGQAQEAEETTILFAGEPARIVGYFWPKGPRSRFPRHPPIKPGT